MKAAPNKKTIVSTPKNTKKSVNNPARPKLNNPKAIPSITTRRRKNNNNIPRITKAQLEDWDREFAYHNPKEAKASKPKEEKVVKNDWWQDILSFGKTMLPHVLPLLTGLGDYEENLIVDADKPVTNSLLAAASNGQYGSQVPVMHETGNMVRVTHREYLGDVYSSTTPFSLVSFNINPGLATTFPWLSPIAGQFTGWKPMGIVAEFVSEGSDYANVAGLGYVALASNYNALAAPYTNKRELLNSQFATAAKPSVTFQHWIECKDDNVPQEKLYVRSGAVSSGDLRLYDLSVLNLAVGGNTASGVIIGELWITYDIILMLPRATESLALGSDFYFGTSNGSSQSSDLFVGMTSYAGTNLSLTFGTNIITFPAGLVGYYQVLVRYTGNSALAFTQPSLTFAGGASQSGSVYGTASVSTTQHWQLFTLFNNGLTGTVTFSTSSCINPPGTVLVWVNQRPPPTSVGSQIFDFKGSNYDSNVEKLLKSLEGVESEWTTYDQTSKFLIEKSSTGAYRCLSPDVPDMGPTPLSDDLMTFLDKLSSSDKDKFLLSYIAQLREDSKLKL